VFDDARSCCGKRVRRGVFIIARRNPAHHSETADVIDVDRLQPEEREVFEVNPGPAIFMGREVELSRRSNLALRDRFRLADQGSPRGTERIAICQSLRDEEAGPRVRP
jgi:hypothetical protein